MLIQASKIKTVNTANEHEVQQSYFNAIKTSIDHFTTIEKHLDNIQSTNSESDKNFYEPLHVNKINYIAILVLEKLGLLKPTQTQIGIIEILISLATQIDLGKIDICTDTDSILKDFSYAICINNLLHN